MCGSSVSEVNTLRFSSLVSSLSRLRALDTAQFVRLVDDARREDWLDPAIRLTLKIILFRIIIDIVSAKRLLPN